jgi:hypothetical protein
VAETACADPDVPLPVFFVLDEHFDLADAPLRAAVMYADRDPVALAPIPSVLPAAGVVVGLGETGGDDVGLLGGDDDVGGGDVELVLDGFGLGESEPLTLGGVGTVGELVDFGVQVGLGDELLVLLLPIPTPVFGVPVVAVVGAPLLWW